MASKKIDLISAASQAGKKVRKCYLDALEPDVRSQLIEVAKQTVAGKFKVPISRISDAMRDGGVEGMTRQRFVWLLEKVSSGEIQ